MDVGVNTEYRGRLSTKKSDNIILHSPGSNILHSPGSNILHGPGSIIPTDR